MYGRASFLAAINHNDLSAVPKKITKFCLGTDKIFKTKIILNIPESHETAVVKLLLVATKLAGGCTYL